MGQLPTPYGIHPLLFVLSVEDFAIEIVVGFDVVGHLELFSDFAGSALTQCFGSEGILDQFDQGTRQVLDVARLDQHSGDSILDQFGNSAAGKGHRWGAA